MSYSTHRPQGYTYLKIFSLGIVLLIVGVVAWRSIALYQDRTFTGDTYTTLYSNGEKHFLVGYLNPGVFRVAELLHVPNLSLEEASRVQLSMAVGVPVDAVVIDAGMRNFQDIFSWRSCLAMVLIPHSFTLRDLNGIDACRYFFEKRSSEVEVEQINYTQDDSDILDTFFRDEHIFNEGTSVAVLNGTEVGGLGGAFSEILDRRGYNVVAVTNSQETVRSSYVDARQVQSSVGSDLLLHLFGDVSQKARYSGAADVVVVLGADVAR